MEKKVIEGRVEGLFHQLCTQEGITVRVSKESLQDAMSCFCNSGGGGGGTGGACGGRCGSAENWDNE